MTPFSSDDPNLLSSGKVWMKPADMRHRLAYHSAMPRKKPSPRQPGPDWFLVEWMASKKMSQAELGRRTGWGKARASEICSGKTEYYREIVNAAASALEIWPWELMMSPAEANRIKRWRAAFEDEVQLRAAEERLPYNPGPSDTAAPLRERG